MRRETTTRRDRQPRRDRYLPRGRDTNYEGQTTTKREW